MVAEAGLTNLICFAGRRNGVTDLQGWENCEKGLKRLMPIAEKYNVVLTMELLNSVGHKDYLCDHTVWGAAASIPDTAIAALPANTVLMAVLLEMFFILFLFLS